MKRNTKYLVEKINCKTNEVIASAEMTYAEFSKMAAFCKWELESWWEGNKQWWGDLKDKDILFGVTPVELAYGV